MTNKSIIKIAVATIITCVGGAIALTAKGRFKKEEEYATETDAFMRD